MAVAARRPSGRLVAHSDHGGMRIFWYIECFYNTTRRHSSLDYLTPTDYENRDRGAEPQA